MQDGPTRLFSRALFTIAILTATSNLAAAQAPAPGPAGPTQVGVVTMTKQAVQEAFELPGRAVAYEQASIRPRVDGLVTEILYTPGKPLNVGDPMFQLDDAAYAATVASDEATLAQANADLTDKQGTFDRASKLVNQGYTQAEVETARAELDSAKATLDSAQAALKYARTELSWTTISSPINGIPEVQAVSVGDLVTAGQDTAMTTVTRLDPIYVDMLDTSSRLLRIRRSIEDGTLTPNKDLDATLVLEDGQVYSGKGRIVAPSAVISTTTSTISVRFQFDNPDRKILPGMFLRGTVQLGTFQAYLVPQRATTVSTTGDITAFVVKDGKTELVKLDSTGTQGSYWIVTGGLSDGDELVVDGLKNLASGAEVSPVAVTIDADGLTKTEETGSGGAPASGSAD